jgi:hypothetical protein
MAFAVVERISPITVAGAALDSPVNWLTNFPIILLIRNYLDWKHLMLKIQNSVAYYTSNRDKIALPFGSELSWPECVITY